MKEDFLSNLPLVRKEDGKNTAFHIRGIEIGGNEPVIIGGPCAVESEDQIMEIAMKVKELGAHGLRGGVFKPRSSPYSFQGLGEKGLEYLNSAREKTGLFTVIEVISVEQIELVSPYADILQIGSRNMQNFDLLKGVGKSGKPVLLKRGLSATIQEFLQAAEYILYEGNNRVILCERGIRTFENITRNTLDINAIPLLKQLTHLPVFADPSHGTGRRELVNPVAKAALSAGAHGLIIEVHGNPEEALSDGYQSLDFSGFKELMEDLCLKPEPTHTVEKNFYPSEEDFKKSAETYGYIPVSTEFTTDSETPVTAFSKLTGNSPSFLLESVERGEQVGRYSFIGWEPLAIFKATGNNIEINHNGKKEIITGKEPLGELRDFLNSLKIAPSTDKFSGGAVGYLSYDYVRQIEKLPEKNPGVTEVPDLYWIIPRYIAGFDHVTHKIKLTVLGEPRDGDGYSKALHDLKLMVKRINNPISLPPIDGLGTGNRSNGKKLSMTREQYMEGVEKIRKYITEGDAFQVVFSQRIEEPFNGDPFLFYRLLRTINPSPYLFYLNFADFQMGGSSPEVMVKSEGGKAILKPIAGTRPRGKNTKEDEILKDELLSDEKERAEHIMLVDLGRNDLGRVCRYGTVKVTDLMNVEYYSHVMHIVSTIEGELNPDFTAIDLLKAVFPAGTLSGAPKIRAMEIIEELEPVRREFYGGAVGYISAKGDMDTCITIRTVLFKDGKAYLQAGAGIVYDSVPEKEYEETMNKAGALLTALDRSRGGSLC